MNKADEYRHEVVSHALTGPGVSSAAARRAAFDNAGVDPRARALVEKVARHAWKVTAGDVAGAAAAGLSEDEIFELVVCAALGQATRQLEAARAAVQAAVPAAEAPRDARSAPEGQPPAAGGMS